MKSSGLLLNITRFFCVYLILQLVTSGIALAAVPSDVIEPNSPQTLVNTSLVIPTTWAPLSAEAGGAIAVTGIILGILILVFLVWFTMCKGPLCWQRMVENTTSARLKRLHEHSSDSDDV